jgi:hypothetical protein
MSVYKWDGLGAVKGFWTNWDEDEVNEMQNDLASIEHMEHLKNEVVHLKTLVRDTSTGHIKTAIGVLEERIKELTPKPQPKRVFSVKVMKRDVYAQTNYYKEFENASDAWDFYDCLLNDAYWLAQEPIVIRK